MIERYNIQINILGEIRTYADGVIHREDGPAIIDIFGNFWWLTNGELHREDGPAIIYSDGDGLNAHLKKGDKFWTCWYLNGQRHRKDGPAVECGWHDKSGLYHSETREWYIDDEELTKEEFLSRLHEI